MMRSSQGPIIILVGTRPEAIKMAPVYLSCKRAGLNVMLCATMQHKDLLADVFPLFNIVVDVEFGIMQQGQDLFYLTQSILQKSKELYMRVKPSLVLVQGDTTSAMAAALAAFYLAIPVGHVEAGLRTGDMQSPFPEEMNRRFLSLLAQYHFAPTEQAAAHLLSQGITEDAVFLTGNSVVDALCYMRDAITGGAVTIRHDLQRIVAACRAENKPLTLLTVHRRESFNGGITLILQTIKQFLLENPSLHCIYSFHPNPHVLRAIEEADLRGLPNLSIMEPLSYQDMVYALLSVDWVMTDSGGIQEEAISLNKCVLVLRDKTERMEGVAAGLARLVGADACALRAGMHELMATVLQPSASDARILYGDGHAAEKIATIVHRIVCDDAPIKKVPQQVVHDILGAQVIKKEEVMQRVCVLGLGYIGLPTAIVIAENGIEVVGVDVDEKRVRAINTGDPVIQESSVFEKLHGVLQSGAFRATTTIEQAHYFIIAVPTPFYADKSADLSYVFSAAEAIASVLRSGNVVILESTVPVGTTKQLADFLEQLTRLSAGRDFFVAHCPERVLPGNIFHELVENARIIGGVEQTSLEPVKWLYKKFVRGPLYLTDAKTAEMVKLVENSSRDVLLAFANQVASMAYEADLNPYEVIELANKHPRVNILTPTSGVGGHCIAVDPWFLINSFQAQTSLLKVAREVNDRRPQEVVQLIRCAVDEWRGEDRNKACTVLLLGVTYKPDVDDIRESPAMRIAKEVLSWTDTTVLVSEPHLNKAFISQLFGMRGVTVTDGLAQADIVVFLVGHKRFKAIDQNIIQTKKIIDVCGIVHTPRSEQDRGEYFFWPANGSATRSRHPIDQGDNA